MGKAKKTIMIENQQTNSLKTVPITGEEYIMVGELAKPFWESGISEHPPKFVIFMGPVGSGKTTLRRQQFATGYVHFEFGEIFNAVKKVFGEDNPILSTYASFAGEMILSESLGNRKNMVIEILGDNDLIDPVINKMKEIGYEVTIEFIKCGPVEAYQRHIKAVMEDPEYHSAYYTEAPTLSFFYRHLELGEMASTLDNRT